MKKFLNHINEEVKHGKSVVVSVATQPEPAPAAPAEKVDAVTSATLKNNMYIPMMPVMGPPPLKKKEER